MRDRARPRRGGATIGARANVGGRSATLGRIICFCLLALCLTSPEAGAADNAAQPSNPMPTSSLPSYGSAASIVPAGIRLNEAPRPRRANFEKEAKSRDAQRIADWVVDVGDNHGMPFLLIDKREAKVFVFHADGRLRGAAPCLLGLALGDDTAPGIGDRKLSEIPPQDRTTPAGRFVASIGYNYSGKDVLWVDYDSAVSLHRVVTSNAAERRLQRLATPTPSDNRISFGCINVPESFFNDVVSPAFAGTYGIVYILPETRPKKEIFASYYDID
ncbi:MAG: hypothetical protein MUF52_07270 [Syntrophobacteraceae bacterium]|nr:hypothetical protein [Syntrophobacteraceae bacterium]